MTNETNPLIDPTTYHQTRRTEVDFSDRRIARITRLRLLSDKGYPYWDLSYCHGELHDGTPVRINLPVRQFRKKLLRAELLQMCRDEGVFGKKLGLFDAISHLD